MKITKRQLKQLIVEEIGGDQALVDAIKDLSSYIEDLDISIDYLAAAFTGESALSLGGRMGALGRSAAARAVVQPDPVVTIAKDVKELKLKEIIQEELEDVLNEN